MAGQFRCLVWGPGAAPAGQVSPPRLRQRRHHRGPVGVRVGWGALPHCSSPVHLRPAPWTWVCHKRVSSVPGTLCTAAAVNKAIAINPDMRCTCALEVWAALAPAPAKVHLIASWHTSHGPIRDIPERSCPTISGHRQPVPWQGPFFTGYTFFGLFPSSSCAILLALSICSRMSVQHPA